MALDLTGAVLTFSDEFNTFSWNSNGQSSVTPNLTETGTWTTHYWWGWGDRSLPGNGELGYYADPETGIVQKYPWTNPFSVQDGVLTITARPSPEPGLSGGLPYVSGMITTEGTFSQKYGYFEMRADIPAGKGLWPAFWMLNDAHTWPPEMDIMEVIGSEPHMLHTTAHTGIGGHSVAGMQKATDVGDMSTGFHTYGVSIMPDVMVWYFDGREIFRAPTPDDLEQPLYLIANLAVGGQWPGTPDTTTPWPAELKIDYIKAWQLPLDPTPPPPPPDSTNITLGTGPDTIVLRVSQDYYLGPAEYTVSVDGVTIGGTQVATARHGSGLSDTVTVRGDWTPGLHTVTVKFLNDAYGGTAATDRNLYVDGLSYDGVAVQGATAALYSSGARNFTVTDADSAPKSVTIGSGPDRLVLRVSQDFWQGDAQYSLAVDGKPIGGILTAGAEHGTALSDTITVQGNWARGKHTLSVTFLNDAHGPDGDRNLHVDGITYNGAAVSGGTGTLWDAGTQYFTFMDGALKTVKKAGFAIAAAKKTGFSTDAITLSAPDTKQLDWSLTLDPDAAAAQMNPLLHYEQYGFSESRAAWHV